ncbi:MAG: 2-amino-4-hydroxy-6-hydroxymethyldihydropteridine diphosphokinase [Candidatus Omnitrophica bacterium]|nr:2-amino-4-hydroxy-6-hydroxymethyldihydropteridine diphosphokinase [Candidatus Omnitrophota bacterium]
MSTIAFVGVGSNLGNRRYSVDQAKELLAAYPTVRFVRSAPCYETEPVGGPLQGLYLNTVWEVETDLSAKEFLALLLSVESKLGRTRLQKNEPRLIDLDLLFFGDEVIQNSDLIVPHPRLHERWFVLKPLWDLRSDLIHPVLKKSVCELLDQVNASHQKS